MAGIIRIDLPKGVEEGTTSVSPSSPIISSVASPTFSRKGAMLLGYSVVVAKSVFNTALQEIRAGGNEELATDISNGALALGIILGAVATKGLSLIPLAVNAASTTYTLNKANARSNQNREYEASMRGARINYMQGGGYE